MLTTTIDAIRAVLRADPSVTPADRASLLSIIRNHGKAVPVSQIALQTEVRILRRAEVARRLGCSPRTVDRIAREGILRKVTLPGRRRACGFRSSDLDRLIGSGCVSTGRTGDERGSLQD
jgi:hypothetical protein